MSSKYKGKKKVKNFKDLFVWQKAHQLVIETYRKTKSYPTNERFGLISQMRRAAVSVPANIVEGFRKRGIKDKINFYNIAQASLDELQYYFLLSKDLGYLKDETSYIQIIREVEKMLAGLIKSIKIQEE